MTEDVRPEKIRKTQDALSKYFKKPPLTEKLLKKPPFRFLHDIVTAVMKETGFLEGVFSPDELNSENIKDRDGKIAFLEKLISTIKSSTGSSISAKPSKIVAGLEVNKTLDLLLILAKALEIRKVGNKPNATADKKKDAKETTDSKTAKQKEIKNTDKKKVSENDKNLKKVKTKDDKEIDKTKKKVKEETAKDKVSQDKKKNGKVKGKNEVRRRSKQEELKEEVNHIDAKVVVTNGVEDSPGEKTPSRKQSVDEAQETEVPQSEAATVANGVQSSTPTTNDTEVISATPASVPASTEEPQVEDNNQTEAVTVPKAELNGQVAVKDEKDEEVKKERIPSGVKEDREKEKSAKLKRPQSARVRPGSSSKVKV